MFVLLTVKLIFDTSNLQVVDCKHESALGKHRGTTFVAGGAVQAWASWRTVGGRATPTARSARLAAGRGAERNRKRLPSCSSSVSVNDSRSAKISGQEARGGGWRSAAASAKAAMRSSISFLRTRARKLHETWPRMVSSSL